MKMILYNKRTLLPLHNFNNLPKRIYIFIFIVLCILIEMIPLYKYLEMNTTTLQQVQGNISIINIIGERVYTGNTMNTDNLPPGIYLVHKDSTTIRIKITH